MERGGRFGMTSAPRPGSSPTSSRQIYPDVAQTRALLLTDDYLLDLF